MGWRLEGRTAVVTALFVVVVVKSVGNFGGS